MHLPKRNDKAASSTGNQSKTLVVGTLGSLMNNRSQQPAPKVNMPVNRRMAPHVMNSQIGNQMGNQMRGSVHTIGAPHMAMPIPQFHVLGAVNPVQGVQMQGARKGVQMAMPVPVLNHSPVTNPYMNAHLPPHIIGQQGHFPNPHLHVRNDSNQKFNTAVSQSGVRSTQIRNGILNQKEPSHSLQALGSNAKNASQRNSMLSYAQNTVKRLQNPVYDSRKRKSESEIDFHREQVDCCIAKCLNTVTAKTRFKLRLFDDFKPSYIANGWNKVCDFHFFWDRIKHKQLNRNDEDTLLISDDEDDLDIHRYLEEEDPLDEVEDISCRFKNYLKRKRNVISDDEDRLSKSARGSSKQRSPQRSKSHFHRSKRISLGRINTNVVKRKKSTILETVSISPDPDAEIDEIHARNDSSFEEGSEYSDLNTTSSTQNLDDSLEGSQGMHFLFQLHTPITPSDGAAYDELTMMNDTHSGSTSIQKLFSSNRPTGFTPKSPGVTSADFLTSSPVNTAPSVQFPKFDLANSASNEEKRLFSPEFSNVPSLESHSDFMANVLGNSDSHWKDAEPYMSKYDQDPEDILHSTMRLGVDKPSSHIETKNSSSEKLRSEVAKSTETASQQNLSKGKSSKVGTRSSGNKNTVNSSKRHRVPDQSTTPQSRKRGTHPKSPNQDAAQNLKSQTKTRRQQKKQKKSSLVKAHSEHDSHYEEASYPFDEESNDDSDDSDDSFFVEEGDREHHVDVVILI